jgi:antitoxin component YwqK of YwqJK toxin-antitoxin module
MARRVSKLLCRLAVGSSVSLGCLAAIAEDAPRAAAEAHIKIKEEQQSQAVAADADAEAPPATADAQEPARLERDLPTEVITERFPNRAVKIERHVAQDEEGNYFNHGPWSQWDEKGVLKGSGEYRHGLRQGKWVRWFNAGECKIISSAMYKGFEAPFVAEATFVDGKLHGVWSIYDSQGRVASEWNFDHGELHGKSVWYFHTGHKQREVEYQQGQMEGELLEWAMEADPAVKNQKNRTLSSKDMVHTLVTKALYQNGRRHASHVENYSPGVKKSEGIYLYAKETTKTSHDFWNGEVYAVTLGKEGNNQRHGHWIWWYKDGGKQMEGDFDRDQPVGLHVWWHPNGQKMTEGEFEGGLETGRWVWWHANGQKMTEGTFQDGKQIGKWVRWSPQGKVEESRDFDQVQLAEEAQPAPILPMQPEQIAPPSAPSMRQPRPSRIESARRLPVPQSQTQRR